MQVAVVVIRNLNANLSLHITTAEKAAITTSWMEVLQEIVPESYLSESYNRAFADKTDGYPVTALEVKLAYEAIKNEEPLPLSAITLCNLCDSRGMVGIIVDGVARSKKCKHQKKEEK